MIIKWIIKWAIISAGLFIGLFTLFASGIIFWRSIEIVQALDFTRQEEYGIVGIIGFMLIWLCSMAADSAEHLISIGCKK